MFCITKQTSPELSNPNGCMVQDNKEVVVIIVNNPGP